MPTIQTPAPVSKQTESKLRVTVLYGGPSAEREVSLASGRAVADALERRGHKVRMADIAADDLAALDIPADVVFPALHGTFGEDGTVQRLMSDRKLRFVGSLAGPSSLAIDKVATKRLAARLGVPTPEFVVLSASDAGGGKRPDPPCVIKPIREGSSVDVTIARSSDARDAAVQRVIGKYDGALVERFIEGREITISIVGDCTLPPIAIRPQREFYDYEAKYEAEDTEYAFDTGLDQQTLAGIAHQSRKLFTTIGARHLARIDWIVDASGAPWFLELNTLPGFTSHSLLPKAAERAGISFDELIERLVRMAREEAPR